MPAATKKLRAPAELESEESKAHEAGESPEDEVREGSEDAPKAKTSRKRGAKNAQRTKAPMDSEGCGCGGKKGGTCDGDCASKRKRSDALTPQEYLTACELGIEQRSRSYIRARLDAAARLDLKCGNGSISEGEKCHVGAAQKAPERGQLAYKQTHKGLKEEAFGRIGGRVLSNRQVRQVERGISAKEARTGKTEKLTTAQRAALISTRGTASRRLVASHLTQVRSADLKRSVRATKNTTDPGTFAISRVAKRELFNRRVRTGARLLGAGLAIGAVTASTLQTRRRDSIWAEGFAP